MRRNGRTGFGTANSSGALPGSGGNSKTQAGTANPVVATGDALVADCGRRFYDGLVGRGVPRDVALETAQRVVRLAASDLPRAIARYRAARWTRQALARALVRGAA